MDPGSPQLVSNRHRSVLLIVCAVALTLRLGLYAAGPASDIRRAFYGDSPRYIELAQNLLTYHTLGIAEENSGVVHIPLAQLRTQRGEIEPRYADGLRPEVLRTPGYPAWIAGILGWGLSLHGVLAAQCFLSVLGVAMVYLIAQRLTGSSPLALTAAAIVAVHPADILSANSLLTETVFTTTTLAGLWLVLKNQPGHTTGIMAGGLMLGLSVLVRPITALLGPALAAWAWVTDRGARTAWIAVVLAACSLLPTIGWAARNAHAGLGYRISSVPYINNYFYTAAYMDITRAGKDTRDDWPATVGNLFETLKTRIRPGEDVFAAMNRLTLDKIATEPTVYAKVILNSVVKLMTDHSASDLYKTLGWAYQPTGLRDRLLSGNWSLHDGTDWPALLIATSWMGWNAVLTLLMLAGLARLTVQRQWPTLLLLGGGWVYFALATQATGLERFRVPILGLQAVCAAAALFPILKTTPQQSTHPNLEIDHAVTAESPIAA